MYTIVLITSTIVMVTGLGGLLATQSRHAAWRLNEDAIDADWYARAAIELAWSELRNYPDWRRELSSGIWIGSFNIGRGTLRLELVRVADGDADPYNDQWQLIGTGRCNAAVRMLRVNLIDGSIPDDWRTLVN
ncbi:MAG: hypothetical protein JNG88_01965 [Phycisphaerales bacterium]|nr:hypothetical protein [Phycisphaerales bacterium]